MQAWAVLHEDDGIAYAGTSAPAIRVNGIRALDNYKLWVRLTTGEEKTFDFAPLLEMPCYAPLKDDAVFLRAYILILVILYGWTGKLI